MSAEFHPLRHLELSHIAISFVCFGGQIKLSHIALG